MKHRDPGIDSYYRKIDSLEFVDSTTLFGLLANTNYELSCGRYLIQQVAKERPELLIRYMDKKPTNAQAILDAIKGHLNNKEITRNVRTYAIDSPGKDIIVKQRTKRINESIVTGFKLTGVILLQIVVIALLVVLFTKI